jgi:hypothetical protein
MLGTMSSESSDEDSVETDATETSRETLKSKKEQKSDARAEKRERKRQQEEYKDRKVGLKALKSCRPSTYSREVNYDKFDAWFEEVDEWRTTYCLSEFATVTTVSLLVSKAAKDWYRTNVKEREREWTLKSISKKMFDDLFPPNYART